MKSHSLGALGAVTLLSFAVTVRAQDLTYSAPDQYYLVTSITNDSVEVVKYEKSETIPIKLDNRKRRIDLSDINKINLYSSQDSIKSNLLRDGWICIANPAKASSNEVQQERAAGQCGSSLPSPTPRPTSALPTPRVVTPKPSPTFSPMPARTPTPQPTLFEQLWENWDRIVGVGILIILFFALRYIYIIIRKLFFRVPVELILAGVPAAGKSALFIRLHNPDADREEIERLEPSAAAMSKRGESITSGKYVFYPKIRDIPGSATGKMIDQFIGFSVPGRKEVLVLVLAPAGRRMDKLQSADGAYLQEQSSYSEIIKAIAQSKKMKRPAAIAIFLNKCDLYGSLDGVDGQMNSEFSSIIGPIEKSARESKIPFIKIYGSALLGTNTGDFLSRIARRIVK